MHIPQMPLVENFALIILRKLYYGFRIAFLSEFSKDQAHIRQRYGDIPNRSDAGVFKVGISLVWRQFQLKVD